MIALAIMIIVAGVLARLTIRAVGLRRAQPYYRWNTGVWEAVTAHYRRRGALVAATCAIIGALLIFHAKLGI